jgi:hypothetical protein
MKVRLVTLRDAPPKFGNLFAGLTPYPNHVRMKQFACTFGPVLGPFLTVGRVPTRGNSKPLSRQPFRVNSERNVCS